MGSGNSTPIGVTLALVGGLVQSFGFIAQKVGHNRVNKLNEELSKEDHKSILTQWIWWIGIIVYTAGGTMNTTALNFAAQSIISCMFSAQLAWIAVLSHFVLKEKLALKDVIAIIIIAVGIVVVVLFGPSTDSDEELTIDVLRDLFQQIPYIITVSILTR